MKKSFPENGPVSDYSIRSALPEDLPEILNLLEICLGDSVPRSAEYWEWKHLRNPFGVSPSVVAEAGGKLVGLRVFMRWKWKLGNKEVQAVRAVDTVTHPDWRGKGIFSRLTSQLVDQMQKEQVSFVFNTPNNSSRPGYLKMGWKMVTRLPVWIRPLSPLKILLAPFQSNKQRSWPGEQESGHLDQIEGWENGYESDKRYHTARSMSYFRWRYQEIPGFRYFAASKEESDAEAQMIFRIRTRRGLQELSISEIFLTESQTGMELGQQLLNRLASNTEADYMIAIAAAGTAESRLLKRSRFLPLPLIGPAFTVRILNTEDKDPDPTNWANWRCSIGDLELF